MQKQTICYCGKCKVKCNKHHKIAKCADCKKRRKLGTIIERDVIIRHVCFECFTKDKSKLREERNQRTIEELRKFHQAWRENNGNLIPVKEA